MRRFFRELRPMSYRSGRKRRPPDRRPTVESLEERALLSTGYSPAPHGPGHGPHVKKATGFQQINLVSDLASAGAQITDSDLKNPWGMAYSASSPFWISDQQTGVSTIYTVTPSNAVTKSSLTVAIPAGAPTGQVVNSSSTDFLIQGSNGTSVPAAFIFDTINGTITGWNPGSINGSKKAVTVLNEGSADEYTGLALGTSGGHTYLYAANTNSSPGIDVYDSSFKDTTLAGNFVDPKLKKGFGKSLTPYNIANIGGQLYVTYTGKNFRGGAVAVFNTDGTFVRQIAFNNPSGHLQAPWGLTIAPSTFGKFSNALLVGNFGNGRISAFNARGKFLGQLTSNGHKPIVIPGLWALGVGNGQKAGSASAVYFTAGINHQSDGLFGALQPSS